MSKSLIRRRGGNCEGCGGSVAPGRNYILTLSPVEPRENPKTLFRVFADLRGLGFQLLIAGASGWKRSALHKEYQTNARSQGG